MENYMPEIKPEVECRWLEADEIEDSELVVHDSNLGLVHVLNRTAGMVFELCDGKHTIDDIVAKIQESYKTNDQDVHADVRACLDSFQELKFMA